ncbi:hypothetical protein L228DRAFT_157192 [Xylona heveae TC161]|uniref:Uncharacterized protein n=1 Tax=Xylona heveae (strain CBS 132557 / TC161) TaxID=1328760 RepID=A0A165G2L8_XYLHT|nr:hypothetical protein L228DRAFT_157192 [Xylona heveae TC161]KZF21667.1 hypothetical protein L228DRAFT_157192 [Xylona heveae TC161]
MADTQCCTRSRLDRKSFLINRLVQCKRTIVRKRAIQSNFQLRWKAASSSYLFLCICFRPFHTFALRSPPRNTADEDKGRPRNPAPPKDGTKCGCQR